MKKRFTEEQVVTILGETRASAKVGETCWKYGISDAAYYKWKFKFNETTVSETKRVRELEQEDRKLKTMLAGSMLEIRAIKDVLWCSVKKVVGPKTRRTVMKYLKMSTWSAKGRLAKLFSSVVLRADIKLKKL